MVTASPVSCCTHTNTVLIKEGGKHQIPQKDTAATSLLLFNASFIVVNWGIKKVTAQFASSWSSNIVKSQSFHCYEKDPSLQSYPGLCNSSTYG